MNSLPVWFGPLAAFLFGSVVGSFLNAVIHRLPLGISLLNPRRSFCPQCKHSIPWYQNIPMLSFLALRGSCAFCKTRIPFRYFFVELLTATLFAMLFVLHAMPDAFALCVLATLLIAATFIDIDHLIIPDEITIGGTVAGVLFCIAIPSLMQTDSRIFALLHSLLGAAAGFVSLWIVVQLGKLAFGKKKITLDKPTPFRWVRKGETAEISMESQDGGEAEIVQWEEIFYRPTDELVLHCETLRLRGEEKTSCKIKMRYDQLKLEDGSAILLDDLDDFEGTVTRMVVPREAMGFGDVKFLAAIGAFLGWQAVLFTIVVSSLIGCVAGVSAMLITRGRGGGLLPYGPFLAVGAMFWMLGGRELWHWYLQGGFLLGF